MVTMDAESRAKAAAAYLSTAPKIAAGPSLSVNQPLWSITAGTRSVPGLLGMLRTPALDWR